MGDVEELTIDTLDVQVPAGGSIDMERVVLERVVVAGDTDVVSAAAGAAERVDWRGLAGPQSRGTATRLAVERLESLGNGGFRVALASAEVVADRNGDTDVRLHDVALDRR